MIVVGAGPAGCAAAILLAKNGYRVRLFDRRSLPRPQIGESLPPKVEGLLSILGVREAVQSAGFVRMAGTTVCHDGSVATHAFDSGGTTRGFQVERARFDGLLQDAARALGVEVVDERAIHGLWLDRGRVRGVRFERSVSADGEAAFVIDATGSRALAARRLGWRRRDPVRTVAVTAYYAQCRLPEDFAATDTLFEMLEDGWIWSVLRADGRRNVTLGVDPSTLRARTGSFSDLFETRIRSSRLVSNLVRRAERVTDLSFVDATCAESAHYAQEGLLLAGDAASVIDPLTSQGVYKALQSGIVAAAAVHTCLSPPGDSRLALSYYEEHQRRMTLSYAAIARSFYRASPFARSPFWAARVGDHDGPSALEDDLWATGRAERRARFARMVAEHGAHGVGLRRGPGVRLLAQAGVVRGRIAESPALVRQDLTWADETLLVPILWAQVSPASGRSLADVCEGYARASGLAPSSALGRRLRQAVAELVVDRFIEAYAVEFPGLRSDLTPGCIVR